MSQNNPNNPRSSRNRRMVPSATKLSRMLDQLEGESAHHRPAPLFGRPSPIPTSRPSYGDQLSMRPVTNILANPNQGFGSRPLIDRHNHGFEPSTRAERPLAMPQIQRRAHGSQPPHTPTPTPTPQPVLAAPSTGSHSAQLPIQPAQPYSQPPVIVQEPSEFAHSQPVVAQQQSLPAVQPALGRNGAVISMFSARGGVGATTVAINTAATLAARGAEVAILDFSFELGDIAVALDAAANTSLAAVAREAAMLDGSTVRRRMTRHSSGVWLLGQEGNVDDLDDDLPKHLPDLFKLLRRNFDFIIIDGLRDFSDRAIAALDASTHIQLVLGQDVMSVRRAARAITLFRRLGYADNRLRLAVSRASKKSPVTAYEIERSLSVPVVAMFREDAKRVETALNAGVLVGQLSKQGGIADDIGAFAGALHDERAMTSTRASEPTGMTRGIRPTLWDRMKFWKGSR